MEKLPKLSFTLSAIVCLLFLFGSCQKNSSVNPAKKTASVNLKTDNVANGLIAYWPLDSNARDYSGYNNNGSAFNVISVADRFGNPNHAFYFNGFNSYIKVPDNASLRLSNTDFTLNAWVRIDTLNTSYGSNILSKHTSGVNDGWSWSITGYASNPAGVVFFGPGGGSANAFGTHVLTTGQWCMVTSVYSASSQQLSIYVNGVLDNVTSGVATPNSAINATLFIGRDTTNQYFFKGALDELRIYNSALSISSIQQLYNTSANPANNLIAYWPFNNSASDSSGNHNNGTAYNVTSVADRFGNPNHAYHFDGSTSYITVPDNVSLRLSNTDFTLNAWVKMDSYNSSYGSNILSKHTSGVNDGWSWSITGYSSSPTGVVFYGPGGGNTNAFGTQALTTGQWYMITSVYSAANQQLSIYVNGVLDNVTSGVATPNSAINATLYIGRDYVGSPSNGYFFQGTMDEVTIYNSALSVSTIKQLYSAIN